MVAIKTIKNPYSRVYILCDSTLTTVNNPGGLLSELLENSCIVLPGEAVPSNTDANLQEIAFVFNHDASGVSELRQRGIPYSYLPSTDHNFFHSIRGSAVDTAPLSYEVANKYGTKRFFGSTWFSNPYEPKQNSKPVIGVLGDIQADSLVYRLAEVRPEYMFYVTGSCDETDNLKCYRVYTFGSEADVSKNWDLLFIDKSNTHNCTLQVGFACGMQIHCVLPNASGSSTALRKYDSYNTALVELDKAVTLLPTLSRGYLENAAKSISFVTGIQSLMLRLMRGYEA